MNLLIKSAIYFSFTLIASFFTVFSLSAEGVDNNNPANTRLGYYPGDYSQHKVLGNSLPPTWRPFNDQSPWNTPIAKNPKIHKDSIAIVTNMSELATKAIVNKKRTGVFRFANTYVPPIWVINSSNVQKMRARSPYPFEIWDDDFDGLTEKVMPMEFDRITRTPLMYGEDSPDGHIIIVDPFTNLLYEMSYFRRGQEFHPDGTINCSTFNIWDLTGTGVGDGNESKRRWRARGSRGSGFPAIAGLIRPEEFEAGEINHALMFAFRKNRKGVYLPPAARTDGKSNAPNTPIEGMRFQLDPDLTEADFDSWGLSREGKIIARAMQRYGLYNGDNGGSMALQAALLASSPETSKKIWNKKYKNFWKQPNKIPVSYLRALDTGTPISKNPDDPDSAGNGSTVIRPLILPVSGNFSKTQEVTIRTATPGASIYYTTDGSEPDTNSSQYTKPLKLHATSEIKAMAIKKGMKNSAITRAPFRLIPPE